MTGNTVSQARYAAYRGVSRKTVTTWKQKGLLVLDADGKIDVEASDRLLPKDGEWRKVVTQGNGADTSSLVRKVLAEEGQDIGSDPLTLTHVRMAVGILKAREQAVENARIARDLIPIEEVGREVEGEYAVIRANFSAMAGEIASDCEGLDAAAIEEVIGTKVAEILTSLSADETYTTEGKAA